MTHRPRIHAATRRCAGRSGFTYIELMVTLAILAVLASVALPYAQLTVQRSNEFELRRALRDIRTAIDAYKQAVNNGQIPGATTSGYPANLDVLVNGVPNTQVPGTNVYFLRRIPSDPFAPNPSLPPDQQWGLRSYESSPTAPKPGQDIFDVYSQSTGVGLNGIAYSNW